MKRRSLLQATTDLLGGQVDMMFEQMYSAVPNIRAGKLRALAVTSAKRSPLFPDLPTMAEAGVPGLRCKTGKVLWRPPAHRRSNLELSSSQKLPNGANW